MAIFGYREKLPGERRSSHEIMRDHWKKMISEAVLAHYPESSGLIDELHKRFDEKYPNKNEAVLFDDFNEWFVSEARVWGAPLPPFEKPERQFD